MSPDALSLVPNSFADEDDEEDMLALNESPAYVAELQLYILSLISIPRRQAHRFSSRFISHVISRFI